MQEFSDACISLINHASMTLMNAIQTASASSIAVRHQPCKKDVMATMYTVKCLEKESLNEEANVSWPREKYGSCIRA